jgi:hypothetical protein
MDENGLSIIKNEQYIYSEVSMWVPSDWQKKCRLIEKKVERMIDTLEGRTNQKMVYTLLLLLLLMVLMVVVMMTKKTVTTTYSVKRCRTICRNLICSILHILNVLISLRSLLTAIC